MPRLALLPIGAFLIWCYVCQQWYVCSIKQKCGTEPAIAESVADSLAANATANAQPAENTYALGFKWNSGTPEPGPGYDEFIKDKIAALPEGQLFEIVGKYYGDETPPEGYSNMGLARADAVKKLFDGQVDEELIVVTSRQVGAKTPEELKNGYLDAITINYKEVPKADKVEIIEIENRISILFPYGSATKEANPQVDEYLDKLAARLKKTDETVSITGHTDATGTEEFNEKLALDRAKHIQSILISKGISADRIKVASKGEKEPVASNDTEEGKRQNRRVELVLNAKQ